MARKVKVRARALKDGESHYISIVDKGANRIPLRMLKNEENPMIEFGSLNVAKLFNRQKAEPTPNAVGIIVGTDKAAGFAAALKAEGYETVEILECGQDDLRFVSTKSEVVLEDTIKFNCVDRAVVIENGQKMLKDWGFDEDNGFAASVAANAFYANMHSAVDTLCSAIYSKMDDAAQGTRPTEEVSKLLADFTAYMLALVNTVPETAFKMEKIQPVEIEDAQGDEPNGTDDTTVNGGETVTEEANDSTANTAEVDSANIATDGNPTVDADATAEADAGTAPEGAPEGDVSGEVTESGQKSESEPSAESVQLTAILEAVTAMTQTMTGMKSEMDTLSNTVSSQGETMSEITSRIAKAEKTAKKSLEAAAGTVVDTEDDEDEVQHGQKSESEYSFKASNIETA
ncbi:transport and binding protein [Vibrio phage V-YDF132]|nr:transport and binding protein [Vibrio phage V-YDF132]